MSASIITLDVSNVRMDDGTSTRRLFYMVWGESIESMFLAICGDPHLFPVFSWIKQSDILTGRTEGFLGSPHADPAVYLLFVLV